jgi:hypothetical protein
VKDINVQQERHTLILLSLMCILCLFFACLNISLLSTRKLNNDLMSFSETLQMILQHGKLFCGLLTKFQIWNTFFVTGSISCRPIKQTKSVNFLMLKCERNFRIWNCITLVYILLYNFAVFIIFDQNELR